MALLSIEARLQRTLKELAVNLAQRWFGVRINKRSLFRAAPRRGDFFDV
jgi:hypothetical protein